MSTLGFVNVFTWDVDQVFRWMNGLENRSAQYAEAFRAAGVDGKRLLLLNYDRLQQLQIWKFGHQEEILRSVHHLAELNHEIEHDTVCVIALRLDCQVRNLHNLLRQNSSSSAASVKHEKSRAFMLEMLSGISDVADTIRCLVPWLYSTPFDDCDLFNDLKDKLLVCGSQLLLYPRTDEQEVLDLCCSILSVCEEIITNSKDPLVIQTANLQLVTLRRNSDEPLGLSIVASAENVHTINQIKPGSPADVSKKVDTGDELIQVNYQTVIGWELQKLLMTFKETKKDMTLTLKKKPHHMTLSGYQKKRPPKKHLPATIPREFSRKVANAKAHSRRRIKHLMASTNDSIPEQDTDDNLSDSEVFHNETAFAQPDNSEPKLRRATVSGGSPILNRAVAVSMENIPSARPRSYFPVSTNIPILSSDLQMRNTSIFEKKFYTNSASTGFSNVTNSPVHSPRSSSSRKSSESASEVAGSEDTDSAPRLLRLVKLDSTKRAMEMSEQKRNESVTSFGSILSLTSISSQGSSIGGLKQQKFQSRSERDLTSPTPSVVLRRNFLRRTGVNRRISCKDLGRGDCQGWL